MILYDSHSLRSFVRVQGSIFPAAIAYALPSAIIAGVLKYLDNTGHIDISSMDVMSDSSVYSGFTFVLGFALVFRTSQSYSRYWIAATSVHKMRSEWFDACASLVAFAQLSKKSSERINAFEHTMIRLFCLLHAMSLEEIATLVNEDFPLLDIEGFNSLDLKVLTTPNAQGRKVEIVFQWIKVYIIQSMQEGLLNVPPPILTRVFQELGSGLVYFHEALQVVIWPFPFPYAQMNAVLLLVYLCLTPMVICQWTSNSFSSGALTLISIVCMKGLDLISAELENPFGEDTNDLPTWEMHHEMNHDLVLLLDPATKNVPRLLPTARLSHEAMCELTAQQRTGLKEYQESCKPTAKDAFKKAIMSGESNNKAKLQQNWANQEWSAEEALRVGRTLGIEEDQTDGIASMAPSSPPILHGDCNSRVERVDSNKDSMPPSQQAKGGEPAWQDLLRDVSRELQDHLKDQTQVLVKQLEVAHERHLNAFELALTRGAPQPSAFSAPQSPVGSTRRGAPARGNARDPAKSSGPDPLLWRCGMDIASVASAASTPCGGGGAERIKIAAQGSGNAPPAPLSASATTIDVR
mmetsp:Transcript_88124/g.197097  ORF Transcript_88124/g.197097 Transcript_88124/m.197097 type:complete len:578 (-) Transcript_88124:43-1776(-)